MSALNIARIVVLLAGLVLLAIEVWKFSSQSSPQTRKITPTRLGLTVLACANLLLVAYIFVNHVTFPLNLEVMEGSILQHFQHAYAFQPIYPNPTPDYVPLAYNPLYYFLSIPFGAVFGVNLFTLRLVAILATIGSALLIYRIVSLKTGSAWYGFVTAGLFAAAYQVMDAYLDTAHSDAGLLFFALLGSYILDRSRSLKGELLGLIVLVAAFWTKQHGALFVIGGVLFLSWRTYRAQGMAGIRKIVAYWLTAGVLGPLLFFLAGPILFGTRFLYFTWQIPSSWTILNADTFRRYALFILTGYPLLALVSGLFVLWIIIRRTRDLNVWHVQFIFAVMSGFLGALDAGSSNNVFIPMGTWFIIVGAIGLYQLGTQVHFVNRYRLQYLALFISFAVMLYNPAPQITPPQAKDSYTEFTTFLTNLHASVYSPDIGQLQSNYSLYPNADWVALEDMIRGNTGNDPTDDPRILSLLAPVSQPNGPAYIITYRPLEDRAYLKFLTNYYVLDTDLGDRFESLETTPHRFDIGYPRYLYRYDPQKAAALHTD